MSNATENMFTATVYDCYGEEIDSFTGNNVAELELRVWTVWSGSEQSITYSISDDLGAELICGERHTLD